MIKAVIFDMDGVISDTQNLHALVDVMIMKRYGIILTEEDINREFAGIPDEEMFNKVFNLHGVRGNLQKAIKEKWGIMMDRADDSITPVAGAVELIDKLRQQKLKLAVASSSPLVFIHTVLSKLNIKEKFEVITSAQEVEKGKPHPEIFLLTARRLGAKQTQCLVIEDSLNGMRAAKEAGMRCIGLVRKGKPKGAEDNYPADIIVNNLKELNLKQINPDSEIS